MVDEEKKEIDAQEPAGNECDDEAEVTSRGSLASRSQRLDSLLERIGREDDSAEDTGSEPALSDSFVAGEKTISNDDDAPADDDPPQDIELLEPEELSVSELHDLDEIRELDDLDVEEDPTGLHADYAATSAARPPPPPTPPPFRHAPERDAAAREAEAPPRADLTPSRPERGDPGPDPSASDFEDFSSGGADSELAAPEEEAYQAEPAIVASDDSTDLPSDASTDRLAGDHDQAADHRLLPPLTDSGEYAPDFTDAPASSPALSDQASLSNESHAVGGAAEAGALDGEEAEKTPGSTADAKAELTSAEEEVEDPAEDEEQASPLDQALTLAVSDNPIQIIDMLTQEQEATEDPGLQATIQYEISHLQQFSLEQESLAMKGYGHALTLDPFFRPNIWAIRRIFFARELWPNLLKLLDAEIRFEEDTSRKAEILMEKGWILLDRMESPQEARDCFLQAAQTNEKWLVPWLSLEKLAQNSGDLPALVEVYQRIVEVAQDPERKCIFLMELARLEDKLSSGTPQRALQYLEEAFSLEQNRLLVLENMERIAYQSGLFESLPDILHRQAQEMLLRPEPDLVAAAAKLRLAAQIAKEQVQDPRAAQKLTWQALELLPQDQLLQRDLLTLSEELSDWKLVDSLLSTQLETVTDAAERARILYRIGLARLEANEPHAAEALDAALALMPGYLPVLVERERACLVERDYPGLVQLWLDEAQAVEARSAGLPLAEASDPHWGATTLWQAAMLRYYQLGDAEGAIELCQRALSLAPDHAGARDLLAELFIATRHHEQLASLIESYAETIEPAALMILLEKQAALAAEAPGQTAILVAALYKLHELQPTDRRILYRLASALEQAEQYPALDEVFRALEQLEQSEPKIISLKLLRARLSEGPLQDPSAAVTLYKEILGRAPEHLFAFASLESILRRNGDLEELAVLLRQAADDCGVDDEAIARKQDLLGQLGSLYRRELDLPAKATAIYAELLTLAPDDMIITYELIRTAEAAGDAALLAEGLTSLISKTADPSVQVKLLLRLAEVLEYRLADDQRAEEMLQKAIEIAPDKQLVVDAVEAMVRRHLGRGDIQDAMIGFETLHGLADEESAPVFLEEQAWLAEGPLRDYEKCADLLYQLQQQNPQNTRVFWAKGRLAARKRDPKMLSENLMRLSEIVSDPTLSAMLDLRAGTLANIAGDPTYAAIDAYRRALNKNVPGSLEATLGLLGSSALADDEKAELLEHIAQQAPDRARIDMQLQLAEAFEKAGRFHDALSELTKVMDRDPDHLPALIVLQRIAAADGKREQEARIWTRMGRLFSDQSAKADAYSRAATLWQELERPAEAAILLRQVLALKPQDAPTMSALQQLYEHTQDGQGQSDLLAHRIYHTTDQSRLIPLLLQRAELRLEKLGDKIGATKDLLRLLELEPKHLEALRQLSRLYDEDGHWARALQLYQLYFDHADTNRLKRPVVIRMAEILHQKLGQSAEAIDICQRFIEQSDEDDAVLELLADLYTQLHDFPHAVSTLEQLSELRQESSWKAGNLKRMARIFWKEMKDTQEARRLLMRARDLDPTNTTIVEDLRQLCRDMDLEQDVERLLARSKDDIREALLISPLEVSLYRKMMQVAEWAHEEYTLLGAMGALCALNAADPAELQLYQRRMAKASFDPKHQLGPHMWREAVMHQGAKSAYGEIWAVIAELVPRLFEGKVAAEVASFGVARSDRLDRKGQGPVSTMIEKIANSFGIVEFDIYLSAQKPSLVAGVAGEKLAIILGNEIISSFSVLQRFRVGRIFSLLRDRAVAVEVLSRDELELLFSAAIFIIEPGASFNLPRPNVEAEARRVGKVLSRKARRALPLAVSRFMQEGGDLDVWINGIVATANRAGLLVSGDLVTALEQLVPTLTPREKKSADEIADLLRQDKEVLDLISYSLSEEYLTLRKELQL